MKRLILIFLSLFYLSLAHAQNGPKFINVNLNKSGFHPGEKAVLTVYKLVAPASVYKAITVEADLTLPDGSVVPYGLTGVTNEVLMGLTSPLQNGEYSIQIKAYLEDLNIVIPLKEFIEINRKRICKIDELLETETDQDERSILLQEKASRLADIEMAKIQMAAGRDPLQEETITFEVSDNLPPGFVEPHREDLHKLYAQVESLSGNVINVILCANIPVKDPEDGSDYDWRINFGDGNEIRFRNVTDSLDPWRDFACVEHVYMDNVRPTVSYTAIDKEGAEFKITQTFDFRKGTSIPLPRLKVSSVEKSQFTQPDGTVVPSFLVNYDPFSSRIPSDAGLYVSRYYPQGRCVDYSECPDTYDQEKPLQGLSWHYTKGMDRELLFMLYDNYHFAKTVKAKINFGNPDTISDNPTPEELDKMFGPAAIIQVNRNTVELTDLNEGVEVKFDGSASFDLYGDDSNLQYYWDFGDFFSGDNFSNKKKTIHVFKNPGHYFVALKVVDSQGNVSSIDWTYIHVTHESLKGAPLDFYAYRDSDSLWVSFSTWELTKLGNTANQQFYWDYGDGVQDTIIGANLVARNYTAPGVYTVKVTFQNIEGKFVTLSKTIDLTTSSVFPHLDYGAIFTPGDIAQPGQPVIVDASSATDTSSYFWNLADLFYTSGGGTEATKNLTYDVPGLKDTTLVLTGENNFSSEYFRVYPVASKKLEITDLAANVDGEETVVQFQITNPTDLNELERIEIFNFEEGFSVIENPGSIFVNRRISGTTNAVVTLTDKEGNKNAFFITPASARRSEPRYKISDVTTRQIERAKRYTQFVNEQPMIKKGL